MKEKLLKIINTYGLMPQLKYFQSEVYELSEAIWEYRVSGWEFGSYEDFEEVEVKYRNHVIEEIADVQCMLNQFKEYYMINEDDINKVIKFKVNRQLERMKVDKTK